MVSIDYGICQQAIATHDIYGYSLATLTFFIGIVIGYSVIYLQNRR